MKDQEWIFENDEEGLAGEPCDHWLIRDPMTDNNDIVAIVPKTGDEEYDHEVVFENVKTIANAKKNERTIREMKMEIARLQKELDACMQRIFRSRASY